MSTTTERDAERPARLTRERVLRTAIELADSGGIDAVTMRRLAELLGVEPMSLYYHLPNKQAILDGVLELVFAEIEHETGGFAIDAERADAAWQAKLRERILASRRVMLRHPWAPSVLESRTELGLSTARYVDAIVGTLRSGGFSYDLIHHAMHALGSRMYGFSQELDSGQGAGDADAESQAAMAAQLPHLTAMLQTVAHDDPDSTLGWCDDQFEFEFGLDLVLDGLARLK